MKRDLGKLVTEKERNYVLGREICFDQPSYAIQVRNEDWKSYDEWQSAFELGIECNLLKSNVFLVVVCVCVYIYIYIYVYICIYMYICIIFFCTCSWYFHFMLIA